MFLYVLNYCVGLVFSCFLFLCVLFLCVLIGGVTCSGSGRKYHLCRMMDWILV